jgi:hypothetical protein
LGILDSPASCSRRAPFLSQRVDDIRCQINRVRLPKEIGIVSVFVGEDQFFGESAHLVFSLQGGKFRLDVHGKDTYFDVRLKDTEMPR